MENVLDGAWLIAPKVALPEPLGELFPAQACEVHTAPGLHLLLCLSILRNAPACWNGVAKFPVRRDVRQARQGESKCNGCKTHCSSLSQQKCDMKAGGVVPSDGGPTEGAKKQPLVRIALEASARAADQIEPAEACTPSPALGSPLPPLRVRYDALQVRIRCTAWL